MAMWLLIPKLCEVLGIGNGNEARFELKATFLGDDARIEVRGTRPEARKKSILQLQETSLDTSFDTVKLYPPKILDVTDVRSRHRYPYRETNPFYFLKSYISYFNIRR